MCLLLLATVSNLSIPFSDSPLSQILPHHLTSTQENLKCKRKSKSFLDITGLDLEKRASKAGEEQIYFQSLSRDTAASNSRKALAKVSSHWANVAQKAITFQYNEVIHLTRKSHEAQLLSLIYQSTGNLLQDAVMKANQVHNNAVERYYYNNISTTLLIS